MASPQLHGSKVDICVKQKNNKKPLPRNICVGFLNIFEVEEEKS